MKKLWLPLFLFGMVGAVSAQAARQNTSSPKPTTIVGCVAQSNGAFRLDHAIVSTDMDADTQQRPSPEASATPKMLSYLLAGADVKAHVGHKVEATGTVSSEKTSKGAGEMKGVPGMKLVGTLDVKSVKMVSATCP
jgi:hypothetical protein